jgi:outer membrane lipoprotein-sorting protein
VTTFNRWCVVAAVVLVVVGVPFLVRVLPAGGGDVGAAELLTRVEASQDRGYSGYVETVGNLDLPVADRFTDIASLFGERTRMRVWWRSDDSWRVDKLLVTGETDLVHENGATTEWSYERNRAVTSVDPPIRLPRSADLTPPMVAQRLLRDVDADELARLPAERVAGREALGLRLAPAAAQSSIDHVDVWADSETGIPLKVEVYGDGDPEAAFRTEFRDFSDQTPAASAVAFAPPVGADLEFDSVLDIADAANQYAPVVPPATLAGLRRSADTRGAVGVYGQGVTRLLAIPMRGQEAGPLRKQLRSTFGMREVDQGTLLTVGPLGVLVTGECEDDGWLVTGTVTDDTLVTAADELARVPRPEPDLP